MILAILLKTVTAMAWSLVSQTIFKQVVMLGMEKLVKSTKNTWDDELYRIAEEKWSESK